MSKNRTNSEEDNFDPIKFINDRFPDEESLVNLDSVINELRQEISSLDEEILGGIHDHAMLNSKMKDEIQSTKRLTKSIVSEIKVRFSLIVRRASNKKLLRVKASFMKCAKTSNFWILLSTT